jgi:translation initiation factor 1
MPKDFALVYSSEKGRVCPDCERPKANCICKATSTAKIQGSGKVRVRRETQGRGGKTVTTISGLALSETNLAKLGSELKRACGSGGTVKEGVIEIQGDHTEKLLEELRKRKIEAKKGGG